MGKGEREWRERGRERERERAVYPRTQLHFTFYINVCSADYEVQQQTPVMQHTSAGTGANGSRVGTTDGKQTDRSGRSGNGSSTYSITTWVAQLNVPTREREDNSEAAEC